MVRCTNADKSTEVIAHFVFKGSYDNFPEQTKTTGTLKVLRLKGKTHKETVQFSGTGDNTQRGPSFELSSDKGYTLTIAAPASELPSQLTLEDSTTIDLLCD
jgi:hypothetical protein